MTIEFTLNTGVKIQANIPDFDSAAFAKQLNDPQTLFVTVGNNGFSKHTLTSCHEITTEA
ncbi:MAG: hypothetical protein ABS939_21670 [Psychrobacillus sp.]